ncbi:hypothetical protein [Citricoccus nitrophenolicus]|uniref:hypothetical protein n=1 Tax=Citricoccus nitrophenolicus TaxID=863575 RepID=UPI0031E5DD3D
MSRNILNKVVVAAAVVVGVVGVSTVIAIAMDAHAVESRAGQNANQTMITAQYLPEGGLPASEIAHHNLYMVEGGECVNEVWFLPRYTDSTKSSMFNTVGEWMTETSSWGVESELRTTHSLEHCDGKELSDETYSVTSNPWFGFDENGMEVAA